MFFGSWNNYRYSEKEAIRQGCWTHIVYAREGTNLNCYIDGKIGNGSVTTIPFAVSGSEKLFIGGGCGNFEGIIDEIKIYDRVLTEEEVKVHYEQVSFSTQIKHKIKEVVKFLKFSFVIVLAIFVVTMRLFWAKDENPPGTCP